MWSNPQTLFLHFNLSIWQISCFPHIIASPLWTILPKVTEMYAWEYEKSDNMHSSDVTWVAGHPNSTPTQCAVSLPRYEENVSNKCISAVIGRCCMLVLTVFCMISFMKKITNSLLLWMFFVLNKLLHDSITNINLWIYEGSTLTQYLRKGWDRKSKTNLPMCKLLAFRFTLYMNTSIHV